MYAITPAILTALKAKSTGLYDAESVDAVIAEHQNQWPGHLYGQPVERRVAYYARGLNRAAAKNETCTGRILQEGF